MRTSTLSSQRGASFLVVLVLLSVMLLAVASLARMAETTTLAANNIASKDAAIGAAELGLARAYRKLADEADTGSAMDEDIAGWYLSTHSPVNDSPEGLPTFNWGSASAIKDHQNSVRFVVQRLCATAPATNKNTQCMVRRAWAGDSGKVGVEALESIPGVQYRITVQVTGPKEALTYVESLVTY